MNLPAPSPWDVLIEAVQAKAMPAKEPLGLQRDRRQEELDDYKLPSCPFVLRYLKHFCLDYYLSEALQCESPERLQDFWQARLFGDRRLG